MNVPEAVKKAAKYLIDSYDSDIDYLGKYEESDVFVFNFSEPACIGYPSVFLYKDGKVEEITDEPALYIIGLLVQDTDE